MRFCVFIIASAIPAGAIADSKLLREVVLGVEHPITVVTAKPPSDLVADAELGLLRHRSLTGKIVHRARAGVRGLFETRASRTPKGDLLLMFPEGNHYAAGYGKVNQMIAYRSSDNSESWRGPRVAFDINYSQHGFVPLIPKGSAHIYAFGTQPIPSTYSRENKTASTASFELAQTGGIANRRVVSCTARDLDRTAAEYP
jgi:hypothetical protein